MFGFRVDIRLGETWCNFEDW